MSKKKAHQPSGIEHGRKTSRNAQLTIDMGLHPCSQANKVGWWLAQALGQINTE